MSEVNCKENTNEKKSKSFIYVAITAILFLFLLFYLFFIRIEGLSLMCDNQNMFIGESQQLNYEFLFNRDNIPEEKYNSFVEENPVEWFVSNNNAEITQDGKLTALSKGMVIVGVKSGDFCAATEVEIRVPLEEFIVDEILLDTHSKTSCLSYNYKPADAYVDSVNVAVGDEAIATYADGVFTARAVGKTTITLSAGKISSEVQVNVRQATESIATKDLNLFVGSGGQINITKTPENAEAGLNFKYKSADENIAQVSDSGWVSAVGKGSTTITVTNEFGQICECTVNVQGYPLTYSDATSNITIYREWYGNAYVYAAHITFSDYSRLGTACGRNTYGGAETTSSAASRQGAILCINGCYSSPNLNYPVARSGVVYNNKNCWVPAVYSKHNGLLLSAWETGGTPGIAGVDLQSLVNSGAVTDTFSFGPPILVNGVTSGSTSGGRAQRTFIGTSGNAGDIWLCVSDGRYNDGVSAGLTYAQCAQYLASKGCTFGVPLDGGGSSTMVFRGNVLNAARGNQRSVVDFVYFR